MSVTDGNLTGKLSEMKISLDGAASTAAPITVTQGGNTANVAVPGPNLGAGLVVTSGTLISSATLSAQSATGAGVVVDFGSAKQHVTLAVTAGAGVSAGVVALEVSQDNTNYFTTNGAALAAPGVTATTVTGAWRYARGNVTTTIVGGTVSATVMAA